MTNYLFTVVLTYICPNLIFQKYKIYVLIQRTGHDV